MQQRFFNFLDDDKTWDIAGMNIPVNNIGRLNGFDTLTGSSIINFQISHETTGYKRFSILQEETILGSWATRQGIIITESNPITGLTLNKNLTDFTRIDLLVGSHEYISTEGGAEAYYSIIQGQPTQNPEPPDVADPGRDVILGYFIILGGQATTLDRVTFCSANSSYLKNDLKDARYNTPGNFTHHLKLNTVSRYFGEVTEAKTTLTLLPLDIKDKDVYGYENYYPNYYWLNNLVAQSYTTVFTKIEAPGIAENQIIHLINPANKLGISTSISGSQDNIFSAYPETHYYAPGEIITLVRRGGLWHLLNGKTAARARKMRNKFSLSYADYNFVEDKLIPSGTKRGNVLRVQITDNAPRILKFLPSDDFHVNGDSEGSLLFVEILSSQNFQLTLFHGGQEAPEGYKPILFSGEEQNYVTNSGRIMLGFVETRSGFKPINWNLLPANNGGEFFELLEKNETKFIYENTGSREENNLVRLKGRVEIKADQAAAPDIGRICRLFPGTIPQTERQIPATIFPKNYDFGVSGNSLNRIPVIITIQGQNTPFPGIFIHGGGFISENYILYLDGIQYDTK